MRSETVRRSLSWRDGMAEFSDCLLIGLLVALASVPVVTAAPALAAGCRAVDRTRNGITRPLWTSFWADFRQAARGGLAFGALTVVAAVAFAVDFEVVSVMPGAAMLRPALGVLAVVAMVIAVRTCEVVAVREQSWRRAVPAAARSTVAEPRGALLVAAAVAVSAVLVWMQPLLVLLVGGPLALAAVATGGRE